MSTRKIILSVIIIGLLILAVVFFANKWRSNVNFSKITITGNFTLSRDEILKAANLKQDTLINIDELNIAFIQDRISKHPEIKKVYVSKNPPDELLIDIIEKRPVAVVNTGRELKLVDEEIELFSFKNFEKMMDLPVINGIRFDENTIIDGKSNLPDLKLGVFISVNAYKKGKYFYNQISEINMSDSNKVIIFSNDNSTPFYFPRYDNKNITNVEYQKEIRDKLTIMKSFFEKIFSSKDKKYSYIDLRFSNQIVYKFN